MKFTREHGKRRGFGPGATARHSQSARVHDCSRKKDILICLLIFINYFSFFWFIFIFFLGLLTVFPITFQIPHNPRFFHLPDFRD